LEFRSAPFIGGYFFAGPSLDEPYSCSHRRGERQRALSATIACSLGCVPQEILSAHNLRGLSLRAAG
jgi:hypothetical protein